MSEDFFFKGTFFPNPDFFSKFGKKVLGIWKKSLRHELDNYHQIVFWDEKLSPAALIL